MWLITTVGFYSVVQKPWDREAGTVTIGARARADLEALRDSYLPDLGDNSASEGYRSRSALHTSAGVGGFQRAK